MWHISSLSWRNLRWVTVVLSYLKELDTIHGRRQEFAKAAKSAPSNPGGNQDPPQKPKRPPRKKRVPLSPLSSPGPCSTVRLSLSEALAAAASCESASLPLVSLTPRLGLCKGSLDLPPRLGFPRAAAPTAGEHNPVNASGPYGFREPPGLSLSPVLPGSFRAPFEATECSAESRLAQGHCRLPAAAPAADEHNAVKASGPQFNVPACGASWELLQDWKATAALSKEKSAATSSDRSPLRAHIDPSTLPQPFAPANHPLGAPANHPFRAGNGGLLDPNLGVARLSTFGPSKPPFQSWKWGFARPKFGF